MRSINIKTMCFISIMAALLCIAAPLAVPAGPVPITLATFVVYLTGALLGWKKGLAAVSVYILLGLAGLPVFSGYGAGPSKLFGPTGGYIIGYLPCVFLTGLAADRFHDKKSLTIPAVAAAMVVGTMVLYLLGTIWFMVQTGYTLEAALGVCVLPFLPGDAVKIAAAVIVGIPVRFTLEKQHLL